MMARSLSDTDRHEPIPVRMRKRAVRSSGCFHHALNAVEKQPNGDVVNVTACVVLATQRRPAHARGFGAARKPHTTIAYAMYPIRMWGR
jgi:hypothetical protein